MMKLAVKKAMIAAAYPLCVTAGVFAVWAIAAAAVDNYYILPSIGETFRAFFAAFGTSKFWLGVGGTLLSAVIGFGVSLALAVGCALGSLLSVHCRRLLGPLIAFMRALPTLVIVLILSVWMSPQIVPAVVSLMVAFPMLYSGLLASFDGVDSDLVEMSRVYRVNRRTMVKKLWMPSVIPVFMPVIGATLSLTVKLLVAAEIMASTARSLGMLIAGANASFDMGSVFALTVVAVLLSVALEGCVAVVTRRLTRWKR